MGFYKKWSPSKTARREYAQKMNEIGEFCEVNTLLILGKIKGGVSRETRN